MERGQFVSVLLFQPKRPRRDALKAWPTAGEEEQSTDRLGDARPAPSEDNSGIQDPRAELVRRKSAIEDLTASALKRFKKDSIEWYRLALLYTDLRAELNACSAMLSRIGRESDLTLTDVARNGSEVQRASEDLLLSIEERSPLVGIRSEDIASAAMYAAKRRSRRESQFFGREIPLARLRDLIGRY